MRGMKIAEIKDPKYRRQFNAVVWHPLQSWEWGEFRKKTGVIVERWGVWEKRRLKSAFQITIHPVPKTSYTVGYLPKSLFPSRAQVQVLEKVAKKHNCIFIRVEPKVEAQEVNNRQFNYLKRWGFAKGRRLFTKYNFVLDLTKSEEELLQQMKSKTRYNIRLAQRKGVEVRIDNSKKAFARYLTLMEETTKRQGFYAHTREYHEKMWESLKRSSKREGKKSNKQLKADLMLARYRDEIVTTWVLFQFGETMYYTYGASTRKYRQVMANNLVMWEAIRLAKERGCKYFDMWGALGPNPSKNDPWYGFHRFKEGYGGRLVEYVGTYDLVIRPVLYRWFRLVESLRWKVLKLKAKR